MNYPAEISKRVQFVDQEVKRLVSLDDDDGNVTIEEDEGTLEEGHEVGQGIVIIDELDDLGLSPEKTKDSSNTRTS